MAAFGSKEVTPSQSSDPRLTHSQPYMEFMNKFIEENRPNVKKYLDTVSVGRPSERRMRDDARAVPARLGGSHAVGARDRRGSRDGLLCSSTAGVR